MRWILRAWFINAVVLSVATSVFAGLGYDGTLLTLLMAALVFTLLNRVIKPIIKLLLLPINLITLGLFGWVVNVVTLLLLSRIVSGFFVTAFYFPGAEFGGFIAPAMQVSMLGSLILSSVVIQLVHSGVLWLLKKN